MPRKTMTIGKARSALYKSAKILGDINAVKRGTVGQRVTNRLLGKISGKMTGATTKAI